MCDNKLSCKEDKGITKVLKITGIILMGITIAGTILLGLSFLVMNLWNWLMPLIFGLTTITFGQAVGIFILSKLLFSGPKHSKPRHGEDFPSKFKVFRDWHNRRQPQKFNQAKNCYNEYWAEEGHTAYENWLTKNEEE